MQSCFPLMSEFRASLGINHYLKGLHQVPCFLPTLLRLACRRAGKAQFILQAWSSSFPRCIASFTRSCSLHFLPHVSVAQTSFFKGYPSSPRTQMTYSQEVPVLPPVRLQLLLSLASVSWAPPCGRSWPHLPYGPRGRGPPLKKVNTTLTIDFSILPSC